MPRLKRYYGQGHLHFITCSCYKRKPLLRSARNRNIFVEVLAEVREGYGFALAGYVIMPEHVHLLLGEPERGTPSTVMQVLKQEVSRRVRKEQRVQAECEDSLPRFWQLRFHDFNVWSRKKRVEKLEYMHLNPVKRGLVTYPQDWPWSSFSFYSGRGQGLMPIDAVP